MVGPSLWLFLALGQVTPAPGPARFGLDPARLHGEKYYLAEHLHLLEHDFKPEDWEGNAPGYVSFKAPGKIGVGNGVDDEDCTFTAVGNRTTFALLLHCSDQLDVAHSARWIWLGPGRALTDIYGIYQSEPRPGLREVVLRATQPDMDLLMARFDVPYGAARSPGLVGQYQDRSGALLAIAAGSGQRVTATLDGSTFEVELRRCSLDDEDEAAAERGAGGEVPCFVRQPPQGKLRPGATVFLVRGPKGHETLEEGHWLEWGITLAIRFSHLPHARLFQRLAK